MLPEIIRFGKSKQYKTTDIIAKSVANYSLTVMPERFTSHRLKDFAMIDVMHDIATQLNEWNFTNPLVATIVGRKSGTGKTHMATATVNKFIRNYVTESFTNVLNNYMDDITGDDCTVEQTPHHTWTFNEAEHISVMMDICNDFISGAVPKTNSQIWHYVNGKRSRRIFPYVQILSAKKLSYMVQQSFKDSSHNMPLDILESFTNSDMLLIDDMFSMKTTDFDRQNFYFILDERLEWKHVPTIITSNLSLTDIADIDTRLADRMSNDMCFEIKSDVPSYRQNPPTVIPNVSGVIPPSTFPKW